MDSREAREILALYRPGDTNSLDPRMAQALELARQDPQLAVWFGQHCAAHVKLPTEAETPAAPPPPPPKPVVPPKAEEPEHIIPLNKPAVFMIGATMLMVLGIVLWASVTSRPQNSFTNYRDRMARLVQRSYPMKIAITDQPDIRQYFRTNGGLDDFTLPRNLEKLPGKGAAVFTWHSQPVSLFSLDAGGNTNLFLFLAKQSIFISPPASTKPQYSRVGRVMTASWTQGGNVYLLTGPNDETALRSFLE